MICRLFFILFLITIINLPASLLASESNNQQNSISNKQSSQIRKLNKNYSYGDFKDMVPVLHSTKQPVEPSTTKVSEKQQIQSPQVLPSKEANCNVTGSNKVEADQILGALPASQKNMGKQCEEIKKNLNSSIKGNNAELDWMISYIGFGILIAIFSMGQEFRNVHKPWVVLSSLLAIITLTLNFYGCIYLYQTSVKLLYESDRENLYLNYNKMSDYSSCIFETLIASLVFASIVFIFLGYQYLFYQKPEKIN